MTFLLMVGVNPQHHAFGFQFWNNPGAFNEYIGTGATGRFAGFWAAVVNASFTIGTYSGLCIFLGNRGIDRPVKLGRTI
jgi:amino acid permease